MPNIYDNINAKLKDAILKRLAEAVGTAGADFCVGYFHLRGWEILAGEVENWTPGQEKIRLLVGMNLTDETLPPPSPPEDQEVLLDNRTKLREREKAAWAFRRQLVRGLPTNQDEKALKKLLAALQNGLLEVHLFLRHPLHAKLYLLHRKDEDMPLLAYLGSSNLTWPGLTGQGELNIDVADSDATRKLAEWFQKRWEDSEDITRELAVVLQESWAVAEPGPYLIYLNLLYHLSREARLGLAEYALPRDFKTPLFEFQAAAVRIAARMLNREGGLILGDVVGLGKTLMATAIAKIFDEDFGYDALIICPKNLVSMWTRYQEEYRLRARIVSLSTVIADLRDLRRYQLVIIDESHNLRNPEGQRYQAVKDYLEQNEAKCLLLSATPYNKSFEDLAAQLGLFLKDDQDLGLRPEKLLIRLGEAEFLHHYNINPSTLAAFRLSDSPVDWQDLLRRFMIRRTRSFIKENYALTDEETGRKYLALSDGGRNWFPDRRPKTIVFPLDEADPEDQFARLFNEKVVAAIADLHLPRYGLGQYLKKRTPTPTKDQAATLAALTRSGGRLRGFCRVNLLKRLESSGHAFLWSLQRHALRNAVLLYALQSDFAVPIGSQEAALIDPYFQDDDGQDSAAPNLSPGPENLSELGRRLYEQYRKGKNFNWLPADFFSKQLAADLSEDNQRLEAMLAAAGPWRAARDKKLAALKDLLTQRHPSEKVLIFTQFADTVNYLATELDHLGALAGVTGQSEDPTHLACRFSPISNDYAIKPEETEFRVLISTDVLSEGQNLQDAAIVVNYDLPWAIIRLIQRAGRVDRLGQAAPVILCYSFMPADKVEALINLRARILARLKENAEVVGADEFFFEEAGDISAHADRVRDLYHEKSDIFEEREDMGVDLSSHALALWKAETKGDTRLEARVKNLPEVVNATRRAPAGQTGGVLVYARRGDPAAEGRSILTLLDAEGHLISESPFHILEVAQCTPGEPNLPRQSRHHELTARAVDFLASNSPGLAGALGTAASPRHKVYTRLKPLVERGAGLLAGLHQDLVRAHETIYLHELSTEAKLIFRRQLRHGLSDPDLVELVVNLHRDGRLVRPDQAQDQSEPVIICSMGLRPAGEAPDA